MSTKRRAKLRTLQQKARQLAIECLLIEDEMNTPQQRLWHREITKPLQAVSAFMLKLQKIAQQMEDERKLKKTPAALFLLGRERV